MALARVQATGKVRVTGGTLALTFSTPPTVGNGIVVLVTYRYFAGPTWPGSLTDSAGNTYAQAAARVNSTEAAAIYFCPAIGATGGSFTITIATAGGNFAGAAVEISGVGSGLVLDKTATAVSSGTTVTAGPTAALTASEVLLAGVHEYNTTQASITVEALSPAWVEEFEELDYTNWVAGEGDTRILPSGASGTTPRAQWTVASSGSYVALIAAFKTGSGGGGGGGGGERAYPFIGIPG